MATGTLPIHGFKDQILEAIGENPVTIVTADTGAGKSTQVPQFLLEAGYKIVITEPRRLAASSLAKRVADEMTVELGGVIGYRTAVDRLDSRDTRCLFCTDGLAMVRELMGHGGKRDVLILDEVHEWNLNVEVLLAWAKRELSRGASFKLVVMSATLDSQALSQYFGGAPVVDVPGRLYPVEEISASADLVGDVVELLRKGRNILVFQPGKGEISRTIEEIEQSGVTAEVLPLHGDLTPEEQARCFKHFGRPKCVVATNVAQTSVTIDDIDAVVDSGMERRIELVDGVEGLYVLPISLSDGKQRKGRAGRTKPGIYIDHCSEADRPEYTVAEILRTRLDQTVLRLAKVGIDMEELHFFHQPDTAEIHAARESLRALGCMDEAGNVTKIGHRVSELPISVKFARMVIEAEGRGVVDDILTAAAVMEVGGITDRREDWRLALRIEERESDVLAQVAAFEAARELERTHAEGKRLGAVEKTESAAKKLREKGIFPKNYFRAKEVRGLLSKALKGKIGTFKSSGDRVEILKALCAGMVDHLYRSLGRGTYENGSSGMRKLARESVLAYRLPPWIVGLPFDLGIKDRWGFPRTLRLVTMATAVDPKWLAEVAPQLASTYSVGQEIEYDPDSDTVGQSRSLMFGGQDIGSEIIPVEDALLASEHLAKWLAHATLYGGSTPIEGIQNVLDQNADRIRRADYGFKKLSFDPTFENLVAFFVRNLRGATRLSDIENPDVFLLPLDEGKATALPLRREVAAPKPKPAPEPPKSVDVRTVDLSKLFGGQSRVKS